MRLITIAPMSIAVTSLVFLSAPIQSWPMPVGSAEAVEARDWATAGRLYADEIAPCIAQETAFECMIIFYRAQEYLFASGNYVQAAALGDRFFERYDSVIPKAIDASYAIAARAAVAKEQLDDLEGAVELFKVALGALRLAGQPRVGQMRQVLARMAILFENLDALEDRLAALEEIADLDRSGATPVPSARLSNLSNLASAYAAATRHEDAISVSREAISVLEEKLPNETYVMATWQVTIAQNSARLGWMEEAVEAYRRAIELAETNADERTMSFVEERLNDVADVLIDNDRKSEAIDALNAGIERLGKPTESNFGAVTRISARLALLLEQAERFDEALVALERSYSALAEFRPQLSLALADRSTIRARILARKGEFALALSEISGAIRVVAEAKPDPEDAKFVLQAADIIALALKQGGELEGALSIYEAVFAEFATVDGSPSLTLMRLQAERAALKFVLGTPSAALDLYNAILRQEPYLSRAAPEFLIAVYQDIADLFEAQGKEDEAVFYSRKVLDLSAEQIDTDPPEYIYKLLDLAELLADSGSYGKAIEVADRIMALVVEKFPGDREKLDIMALNVGPIYFAAGSEDRALALLRSAARNLEDTEEESFGLWFVLAEIEFGTGNVQRGLTAHDRAMELIRKEGESPILRAIVLNYWLDLAKAGRRTEIEAGLREIAKALNRPQFSKIMPPWMGEGFLGAYLARFTDKLPEAFTLLSRARDGIIARMERERTFGKAQIAQVRQFQPVFHGFVQGAWRLAER